MYAIGLGSVSGAREFSKFTGFPEEKLFADPDGACCSALGYARGFAPEANISPYVKLFPMLLGIESEGTIQEARYCNLQTIEQPYYYCLCRAGCEQSETIPMLVSYALLHASSLPLIQSHVIQVLKGYVGSPDKKEVFEGASPFNLLGTGYQRPFELATLRLMNSADILSNCEFSSNHSSALLGQAVGPESLHRLA